MSTLIEIYDGGFSTIKTNDGKQVNVGVINFRTREREAEPIDHIGYCLPVYKDGIIKNLKRIQWVVEAAESVDAYTERQAPYLMCNALALIKEKG